MPALTYAIQQKDFVGTVYTIGYEIARTPEEAAEKARSHHPDAYATPVVGEALTHAVDGILDAQNHATHKEGK